MKINCNGRTVELTDDNTIRSLTKYFDNDSFIRFCILISQKNHGVSTVALGNKSVLKKIVPDPRLGNSEYRVRYCGVNLGEIDIDENVLVIAPEEIDDRTNAVFGVIEFDIEFDEVKNETSSTASKLKEALQNTLKQVNMTSTQAQIEKAYTYHPPKEGQTEKYERLRKKSKELAYLIDELCPNGRYKSSAQTYLEIASMWANKSIECDEE